MNDSSLKGEDGEIRSEVMENFEERDLRVKIKAAISLLNNLSDILKREHFCDLVFELSGYKFQAHRLILALWSPVVMNMLSIGSCKTERIHLAYDQPEAFQQFITFLYTGTFDGNVTDVLPVLLLASTFQISLLRDLCEEHLLQTVTVTNVISLFHISVRYGLACLEWQCADHIRQHLPEVAQHSEMRDLNAEQINSFLGSEHMSKLDPEMKLFLLISWLTEDVSNRQQFLVMLLGHIDWSSVADDFLMDISQTDNFFTSNPSSLYLLLQTLHSSSISLGPYTEQFEQLREEYSYLLNSVVNSSINLGMGKHSLFQPISLSLIASPKDESSKNCVQSENDLHNSLSDEQIYTYDSTDFDETVPSKSSEKDERTIEGSSKISSKLTKKNGKSDCEKRNATHCKSAKDLCEGSMKRKRLRPKKLVTGPENIIFSRFNSRVVDLPSRRCRRTVKEDQDRKTGLPDTAGKLTLNENSMQMHLKKNSRARASSGKTVNKNISKQEQKAETTQVRKEEKDIENEINKSYKQVKKKKERKTFDLSTFPCSECDYNSTKKSMLDKHIRQVHRSNGLLRCPLCQFECKWNKNYKDHLKLTHFKGPPFMCDNQDCTYSSEKIEALMTHRRCHVDERAFVCDICKMSFRRRNNLYAHLKCHNDEKKFKCPVCAKCFKLKNTLDQHVVIHDDLRPYLCDLCGFSTKYQSHLICHKRQHAGDVYPCTFPSCTYSTPKRSQLKAHMRSHLGIRHHVCGVCGKAFIEKSHLVRHERIHSSVKSHKCSICDYASNRADKLREHMNKHQKPEVTPRSEGKNKRKKKKQINEDTCNPHEKDGIVAEDSNAVVNLEEKVENFGSGIYIMTVRGRDDLAQDQRPVVVNESMSSSHQFSHSPGKNNSTINVLDVECETLRYETKLVSKSSQGNNGREAHSEDQAFSTTKHEKELSAMDLLAHIGLNMVDIPNSGEHQTVVSGNFPSSNTPGDNPLNELTEMMLPGLDVSPSLFTNHQTVQQHSMSQSEQQGGFLPSHSVANPNNSDGVLPDQRHQYHQDHVYTSSVHNPHPLIMVPNMNSSVVTHQPFLTQPSQNSSHHPHRLQQQQQQQGSGHLSNYSQCRNFSY